MRGEGIEAGVLLGRFRGQLVGNGGLGDCDGHWWWPTEVCLVPCVEEKALSIRTFVVGTGKQDIQCFVC
jgi:hypothetical protein